MERANESTELWWHPILRIKVFLKKWASFLFIFCLFNQTLNKFYNKSIWKMSIQYMALGFELTTFWLWVSSLNHNTRATDPLRTKSVWITFHTLILVRCPCSLVSAKNGKVRLLKSCFLFSTITKCSSLFMLGRHQTACAQCLCINVLDTFTRNLILWQDDLMPCLMQLHLMRRGGQNRIYATIFLLDWCPTYKLEACA